MADFAELNGMLLAYGLAFQGGQLLRVGSPDGSHPPSDVYAATQVALDYVRESNRIDRIASQLEAIRTLAMDPAAEMQNLARKQLGTLFEDCRMIMRAQESRMNEANLANLPEVQTQWGVLQAADHGFTQAFNDPNQRAGQLIQVLEDVTDALGDSGHSITSNLL